MAEGSRPDDRPKDVFNSTVLKKAKDGLQMAGKRIYRTDRGMTEAFNEVGQQLFEKCAGLPEEPPPGRRYQIEVSIVEVDA